MLPPICFYIIFLHRHLSRFYLYFRSSIIVNHTTTAFIRHQVLLRSFALVSINLNLMFFPLAYLGFSCPAVHDEERFRSIGIPRYASTRDCREYFLCVDTAPRLQVCEIGTVYNSETSTCTDPEEVQGW